MSTPTISVIAIALWMISLAVVGMYFYKGWATPSADGRVAIILAPTERDRVLENMRGMLETVQEIIDGLARNDIEQVAARASAGGMGAVRMPVGLMAKLPMAFKEMGLGVHRGFDELARAARTGASDGEMLNALSTQLSSCIACHATYRLTLTSKNK
ncbi:hypothetical protein MNBD_GAMMA19-1241 [hydrothermal vent metagenome]|uniref:Cytochrome C n=1 Tax=hydrothermal vent metagenome TaxID=652676 RepID=A0A3B1A990_9ZZZZ